MGSSEKKLQLDANKSGSLTALLPCPVYWPVYFPPKALCTMSASPASNGVFVVIPPNNASGLRPPPAILPTSMCQPPGIMQFEEPPLGVPTSRASQHPDLRPMETFLTGEPKALGVRWGGGIQGPHHWGHKDSTEGKALHAADSGSVPSIPIWSPKPPPSVIPECRSKSNP